MPWDYSVSHFHSICLTSCYCLRESRYQNACVTRMLLVLLAARNCSLPRSGLSLPMPSRCLVFPLSLFLFCHHLPFFFINKAHTRTHTHRMLALVSVSTRVRVLVLRLSSLVRFSFHSLLSLSSLLLSFSFPLLSLSPSLSSVSVPPPHKCPIVTP